MVSTVLRLCRRYRVTGLSNAVGQKSPALFHNFIYKRYIEFNFSPEGPFEGEGKQGTWFYGNADCVFQVTFSVRIPFWNTVRLHIG
jgi:hypothetical protein